MFYGQVTYLFDRSQINGISWQYSIYAANTIEIQTIIYLTNAALKLFRL